MKWTRISFSRRGIILSKSHMIQTWGWSCFNPITKVKRFFRDNYYRGLFSKYPHIQCQGCGCGIIEFTITNPNHGETDKWKVCRGCVNFYDRKWTKRKVVFK